MFVKAKCIAPVNLIEAPLYHEILFSYKALEFEKPFDTVPEIEHVLVPLQLQHRAGYAKAHISTLPDCPNSAKSRMDFLNLTGPQVSLCSEPSPNPPIKSCFSRSHT